MKRKSIIVSLLGLALLTGCTTSNTTDKEIRNLESPTYNIIKSSQYPTDTSGEKEFKVYHSDTKSDVEQFVIEYEKLTGEAAPEFDGNMIIAKMGEKQNGGYNISVSDVKDGGKYTEVTILMQSLEEGCLTTMALTNPYVVVELPDNHKDVKFIENSIKINCK